MGKNELPKLDRIEKVDIKKAWETEGRHFTPWLEKEIEILNEALGVEIEIIERESAIGDFKADLFGRELNLKTNVIIENQFGRTDHDHLGKLLTYSAGKDAGIIIWIAEEFREKHRSVLDWLNESSGENRSFFGAEIEVVRIGDSSLAPNFKVVSKPNEWQKTVILSDDEISPREELYREFWDDMLDRIKKEMPNFTTARKPSTSNWMSVGAGKSGVHYTLAFKQGNRFEVGLHFESSDAAKNKKYFNHFKRDKKEIDDAITGEVIWNEGEDSKMSSISVFYPDIEISDSKDELDKLKIWVIERAKEFRTAFKDRVKKLK